MGVQEYHAKGNLGLREVLLERRCLDDRSVDDRRLNAA